MTLFRRTHKKFRSGPERGAVLVEFALVLPIMALIIFGMLEFGMVFNNKSSLQQGTREAARQASVGQFGGDSSCTIYGLAPTTATHELACLIKERAELDGADVRVRINFISTNDVGDQLAVCALYPVDSITGFFGPALSGKTISAKVETRLEQKPSVHDEHLHDFTETPPSGANWSFCT